MTKKTCASRADLPHEEFAVRDARSRSVRLYGLAGEQKRRKRRLPYRPALEYSAQLGRRGEFTVQDRGSQMFQRPAMGRKDKTWSCACATSAE